MGFLAVIREGLKKVWSAVKTIRRIGPTEPPVDELEAMEARDDIFSMARAKLMRDFGMTKDEATDSAREIAFTPEALVPDDFIDTWRVMYPERG